MVAGVKCQSESSCAIVQTKSGAVQGIELETVLGEPENVPFCGYRGIPYAQPPINQLRFKVNCFYF